MKRQHCASCGASGAVVLQSIGVAKCIKCIDSDIFGLNETIAKTNAKNRKLRGRIKELEQQPLLGLNYD